MKPNCDFIEADLMPAKLMIAGASVRAQVQSALRGGYHVAAVDLFADRDTCLMIQQAGDESSSIARIDGFGELLSLESKIRACDAGFVCGGIENRIELVRKLESQIQLLGTSSANLSLLHDPVALSQLLVDELGKHGVRMPLTSAQLAVDSDESDGLGWLSKRVGSSGGLGVELAESTVGFDHVAGSGDTLGKYFQKRIVGESISALYVSRGVAATSPSGSGESETTSRLIGVTQQLVGHKELGASEFQYCGSIGPYCPRQPIGLTGIELGSSRISQIELVGEFLAKEFGLVGVWGIDFIVNEAGVWPVDVNPRLTASAELYESGIASRTNFKSIVDLHVKACLASEEVWSRHDVDEVARVQFEFVEGKAILFNRTASEVAITPKLSDALIGEFDIGFFGSDRIGVTIADIPRSGQTIKPGHPLLTLRVRCRSAEEVEIKLREHAERIYRCL